jgi:hypothetical protein
MELEPLWFRRSFGTEMLRVQIVAMQEEALKAFVTTTLPRSTREVGAFIAQEFGLVYESRSGLIALLHRLARISQAQCHPL